MQENRRPSFFEGFLVDILDDARSGSILRLLPYRFLTSIGVGIAVGHFYPENFFSSTGELLTLLGVVTTINGLLLALCWNSFSRIYDALGSPHFAKYLDKHQLLYPYYFHMTFIQTAQVIALLASLGALFLAPLSAIIPTPIHQISLGGAAGATIFALWYATGAVGMMQGLVEAKIRFDAHLHTKENGPRHGETS